MTRMLGDEAGVPCWHCRELLPAGTPVCYYCGTGQEVEPQPRPRELPGPQEPRDPAPPRRNRSKLRRLYTARWEGTCPKCGELHSTSVARCLIDGSPLVVSFDAFWWFPFTLPVESAEMRCLANCKAFRSHEVPCRTGCGGVVAGRNLKFKFSATRALAYHSARIAALAAPLPVLIPLAKLAFWGLFYFQLMPLHLIMGAVGVWFIARLWFPLVLWYRWPLPRYFRTFTFDDVGDGKR